MCMTGLVSSALAADEPVAGFNSNITSGSAPLYVQFTDTSIGNVSSYTWDFDNDGNIDSTEQNPIYAFTKPGSYSINLTVSGSAGINSTVKTDYITVTASVTGGLADTAWPKLQRDLNNTGQSPYNGPQTNTSIWNYTTGTIGYASPVIGADGTIYVGSYDCKVYAINPDGTLKWTYATGGSIYGSVTIGADGTIYVGSGDHKVYAINPDGTLKWTYTTGNQIMGSVAIGVDGAIYVGSDDYKVYAINPDGTLKWTYTTGNTIQGSAAIGKDGTIYIGSYDRKVYALNPNGTLKWASTTSQFISESPSIGTDGTIYTGTYGNNNFYALNPDGTQKWKYTTGSVYGTPSIAADGTIYIGSYKHNQVYALNPNGTLKWTYTTGSVIFGSIALGADGTIYIGSGDNKVYAINPDGTLKWTYTTGDTIYGSPAIAADGTLYIGSSDGKLYAFKDLAPIANFNATPVPNAPLKIQFNDTSIYYPTSWAWDFGDNETSTEQNPVHTYAKAGNYTVTLNATNHCGSDTETKTERFETLVVTSITVSPASAQLYLNETRQFSATAIDQFGKEMSDVAFNWSNSNENVGTVNASGIFTPLAPGTTNVTASVGSVNAFAEVRVIGPTPDLTVSSVISTTYPISNNKVTATIRNDGTADAGVFKTNFTVDGNTTSIEVPGLNAGNNTTISITDMVSRNSGDSVPIMVMVDPENSVAEANETNNVYTTNETITASGILSQGGRFSTGHDKVNTAFYAEGKLGVRVAERGYYTWFTHDTTATYAANELSIPANATIKSARLYQPWTWYADPHFTVKFNGHDSQEPEAVYTDWYSGQYVFDVTPYFNVSGNNTAIITAQNTQRGYYGTVLVVVYEAANEPYRQVWVNEGADCLMYGTDDPCVGYTLLDNATTDNLSSAKVTTVLLSGDDDDQNTMFFNKQTISKTGNGGTDPSLKYYDVTDALQNGTNELGVRGDGSYFDYAISVLEVTKVTASEANFTANTTNGNAPLSVKFTDTSTGTPANWTWDFGDNNTSTEQNPTHIYTTEGTYTVKLTVSNSLGSDSEEKTGCITVGSAVLAPVADFSANPTNGSAPLSVQFKDESTNTPTSWAWDFDNDGTVDNTTQNPTHTYETVGKYTVKLTATNYGGSNSTAKTDYISVTSDVSAPVANFTTDANSGQVPFTVHFTDNSESSISSWKWDFGDGRTSSEQNPTHTYVTAGSYNVNLTATGPGGSNTVTLQITVSSPITANSYNGGIPLTTAQNGTVSGGLWYDSYPGIETPAQKTFILPAYTKIKWARLYVDVYDGHMQNNYRGNVTINIDANGDSTYEIQKNETFNTAYSFPGESGTGPVWVNDHMNRVTSDYLMWYDLTDAINGQTVNVQAASSKIDSNFDGRIKAMTLVVAYDDGDSDQVYYWVNQGHDTVNPSDTEYTGLTSFSTASLVSGWSSVNLSVIYLASKDGIYTYNGTSLASGVPSGTYYGSNTWDISSLLTAGKDSTFAYNKQESNYYKIPLVLMSVRYPAASTALPDASFTADVTSGTVPLTVSFTDHSTGSPTSWTWDFGDGTNATEQNVSHTYTAAGNYTVNLTISNAGGSDYEVKTDYITVSAPETSDTAKPVIDSIVLFPANATAGSSITISVNATDDKEVTKVTAGDMKLEKTDGVWQGSITAPSAVGSYALQINASDAAGNVAETTASYNVVQLSGSSSIAVSPKISNVAAGSNISPAIVVKNAQSVDDTFKVWISVSELPAASQANLTWFDWTEQNTKIRAGEEVSIPVKADIPAGTAAGLKLFRVNVKSETAGTTGFYTGYLKIV
jgi:PKD repeat protein